MFDSQGVRYVLAGAWNTGFGTLLFGGLLIVLEEKIGYVGVLTVTTPLSITQAHLVQRKLVWRSKSPYVKELTRFASVYLGQYVANVILLIIFVETIGISVFNSQLICVTILILVSFNINRRWTFPQS